MINFQKPIIVVAGPTASGKSSLALKLAKDINGYIINADSRQIYKELKIGTAQPTPDTIRDDVWYIDEVEHYLYGHVSITEDYNLYRYQQDVQKVLDRENSIPILVGGTGLYIDSIVYNYDLKPSSKKETKYSRKELEKMSVKELHSLIDDDVLKKLNRSDRNNPIRLIRTIERGGINQSQGPSLKHIYLLLDTKLENLRERIEARVDQMFKDGLIEENEKLLNSGYSYDLPAMQSIGYQEFEGYFKKEKNLDQVRKEIILHTMQYAKRQKTWFRRNKHVKKIESYQQAYDEVVTFLSIS
jgi:tRNA dimethylallyltransferase